MNKVGQLQFSLFVLAHELKLLLEIGQQVNRFSSSILFFNGLQRL
jgi:hypothetical protein